MDVVSPAAINLDFQTGIAADTLLFGSVRHAWYDDTILSPEYFDSVVGIGTEGDSITDIDSTWAVNLGIGRRFSNSFSGSVAFGLEPGIDDLVSPLSPMDGNRSISIGGQYTMGDVILSGGLQYTIPDDARPETGTPDVARADFADNDAVAVGVSSAYRF